MAWVWTRPTTLDPYPPRFRVLQGHSRNGAAIHPQNMAHRFKRLVTAAGVPKIRPYDLRHSATSMMIAGAADPKAVSEVLGHADPRLTIRVYSYTQTEQRDKTIRLPAGALEPEAKADTTAKVHPVPVLKLVTVEAS